LCSQTLAIGTATNLSNRPSQRLGLEDHRNKVVIAPLIEARGVGCGLGVGSDLGVGVALGVAVAVAVAVAV
jgi:hypothetical protein